MLNVVLNIIGITLVLYSIYVIRKDLSRKKVNESGLVEFKEMEKENYEPAEDFIEDFDFIMDNKIVMSDIRKNQDKKELEINKMNKNTGAIIKEEKIISEGNNINPSHKKIMELESIGLTNEDIAKKLGRGIREIDIVLKIYKR